MTRKLDLIAIGTGSAASAVASKCRAAGWEVAIVDSRPFGGTCALRGCDPKKVLVGAADAVNAVRRMKGKGIQPEQVRINWPELMRFKQSFVESVPQHREASFAKAGIAAFHGKARFVGPTAVQVGDQVLDGRYVVIATGATPQKLNIPGEELLTTSDQFLELESLPRRIVFIGGGYISFEFAHVAVRAGAEVTILHRAERPLEGFDPDLVDQLVQKSRQLGIRVELQTEARHVQRTGDSFSVGVSTPNGGHAYAADLVVHGAGRVPAIDDLNLAAAGVEIEKRGVKVNQYLQSVSNPAVYAAGDAAASGAPPLTPMAGYEGRIVAANLLAGGNYEMTRHISAPTVVFTIPPLAAVGLSEREAHEKKLRFRTHRETTTGWYSSRRVSEDCSGFKVLVKEETGQILGAHLLGPHADELINLFALAIQSRLTAADLKEAVFAYPTHASDIRYML